MGVALFGQAHVDRYRETDGEEGHDWQGTTVLLLTSHGAAHPQAARIGALFALTALQPSSRERWRRSAVVACVLAATVGVLSGLGAIPTFRSG
jgi:hypothetical protein